MRDNRFWQRNPAWERVALGIEPGTTIGSHGCLLCCVAKALASFGLAPADPPGLNRWLAQHNGYQQRNLFVFDSLRPVGMVLQVLRDYRDGLIPEGDLDWLGECRRLGQAVLLEVDFWPWCSGHEMHWVWLKSEHGEDWLVYDPWTGEYVGLLATFARPDWGLARAIYRAAVYKGQIAAEPVGVTP